MGEGATRLAGVAVLASSSPPARGRGGRAALSRGRRERGPVPRGRRRGDVSRGGGGSGRCAPNDGRPRRCSPGSFSRCTSYLPDAKATRSDDGVGAVFKCVRRVESSSEPLAHPGQGRRRAVSAGGRDAEAGSRRTAESAHARRRSQVQDPQGHRAVPRAGGQGQKRRHRGEQPVRVIRYLAEAESTTRATVGPRIITSLFDSPREEGLTRTIVRRHATPGPRWLLRCRLSSGSFLDLRQLDSLRFLQTRIFLLQLRKLRFRNAAKCFHVRRLRLGPAHPWSRPGVHGGVDARGLHGVVRVFVRCATGRRIYDPGNFFLPPAPSEIAPWPSPTPPPPLRARISALVASSSRRPWP